MIAVIPESVHALFWDVDPSAIRLPEHADYVIERIMSRGSWDAMRWLRGSFAPRTLVDFLARKGDRLPPRERAYWQLVLGVASEHTRGGGRPAWAGT